jgi:hypothetical protein
LQSEQFADKISSADFFRSDGAKDIVKGYDTEIH